MSGAQRCDHFVVLVLWENGLEPKLGDALLTPRLPACRVRALTTDEGAGSLRVPRTVLVLPDASGARLEEGFAYRVESFARDEDDELAVQISVSICARCSLPL